MAIRVIDTIKPKNNADFAIVEDIDLKGGFQIVADAAARDAITSTHRKVGMFVVTQDDGKVWKLGSDLTTWAEFTGGGGAGEMVTVVTADATVTAQRSQTVLVASVVDVVLTLPAAPQDGDTLTVRKHSTDGETAFGVGLLGNGKTFEGFAISAMALPAEEPIVAATLRYVSSESSWFIVSTFTRSGESALSGDVSGSLDATLLTAIDGIPLDVDTSLAGRYLSRFTRMWASAPLVDLCWDTNENHLWVLQSDGIVHRINPATDTVVASINTMAYLSDAERIVFTGSHVVISGTLTGASHPVVYIDAATNTVVGTLQASAGMTGAVPAMAFSPGVLWVGWYDTTGGVANVDAYGPGVTTIGSAFQPSFQQVPLAATARPRDMSMLPFGSYVYIASEESVDRFDTGGFTLQTFALGVGEKASSILIAPSESDLWVAGGNKVYRFDPATFPAPGSLLATITVTGATDLRGLTRDSSGYIWTVDKATDGQVHVIDPSTDTVFASIPTLTADTPTEIVWNGGSSMWVTAEASSGPYGRGLREFNMSAQTYTRDFGNLDKYVFVEPPAASGAAGGDLAGTYPNPTLSKVHTRPLLPFTGAIDGDHLAVERVDWENSGTMDVLWDGSSLWTGHWDPYVVRHNPATPTVTTVIDLSSYANRVTNIFSYGSYICALGSFTDASYGAVIIDKATNAVVAFIRAPAGISAGQTAIGLYDTKVWIAYRDTAPLSNTFVRSYDLAAAIASFPTPYTTHVDTFSLSQSVRPAHMCAVGSGLWFAGGSALVQIDTAGPTVTPFTTSFWCSAVMFDGASELWASGDDKVVRINMALFPAAGTEAAVVTVPGANSIEGLATDGTWIYAAEYDTVASIYRINAGVGTEAYDSTIAIRTGDEPYRLAYDGTRLWAGLDSSDDGSYGLAKVVSGAYVENYTNIFNVKFGSSILRTPELNVGTTGAYSKVTRVATAPAPGDAGTQGDLRIVSNVGAAAALYQYHNGAWAAVGSSGAAPVVGDNGRAKRAVAWKKSGAFGGRENSFTGPEESGTYSYNASTGISMSTGTGTVAALYATVLLGPNLYFSGSTSGNVGRLYRLNIATKTATLVSGVNFSATGQLSGTSSHGAGAISADNMCDVIAHRNWLNGDTLACLTPKGLFLVHPTLYTGSYPATLFRGKPGTTDGFLGGRVVSVDDDSTNTNHMGLVIATAPNEGNIYFADWNNNIGANFPTQAIGTNPQAICVDADQKVWIVDRSNGNIFKCSVSPSAALLTVDATITTVANARDVIWNGRHIVVLSVNPTNALTLLNPDDGSIVLQRTSPIAPAAGTKFTFNDVALGGDGTPRLWWDGVSIWGFSNGTSDVMRFDADTLEVLTASVVGSTSNGFCAVSEGMSLYTSPSAYTFTSVTSDLDGNPSFNSILRLDTPLQTSNGGTGLKTVGASGTVLTSNGPTAVPSWQTVTVPTPEINTGDNNFGTRIVGHAGQKQATAQRRMGQFVNAGTSNAVSMAWTGDDILTCEAGFIRTYDATTLVPRGTYDAATAISITPLYVVFGGADRRSFAHDPCAWAGGTGGLFKLRYLSGALTLEGSAYTTNMSVGGLIYDGTSLWVLNTSQNCISVVTNPNEDGIGPTVTLNWTAASSLTTNAGANTRQRMAWDGRYLWTISQSDSKLYKIDTQASGSVVSYTLAGNPTAIAFDGKWLWIPIGTTMYRIDPSSSTPVTSPVTYNMNTVPTGTSGIGNVHYIVPDGRWLWLLNNTMSAAGYGVCKFDPTTGAQVAQHAAVNAPVCAVIVGHGDAGYILVSATSTVSHYGYADAPTAVLGGLKLRGPVMEHATRVTTTPYTIGSSGTPVGANYIAESGASAITLPTIGGLNLFANGLTITVKNISGGGVTVVAGGTDAAEWGASPTTTPVASGAVKRFMWWYNGISGQWLIMS